MKTVYLKPGKDVPVRAGHPWIFSEALKRVDGIEQGELVRVEAATGEALGVGYANPRNSIYVRMLSANADEIIDAPFFVRRLRILDAWKRAHIPAQTDGYRVVHAESDGLPGLIVDRYGDVLVFQIHTAGIDRLRADIIAALNEVFAPRAIVERSDVGVRRQEGLTDMPVAVRYGELSEEVVFKECDLRFIADVLEGQKTGFFLDQRDARRAVGRLAEGRRVLNLFSYTAAFSVHAAMNGAEKVVSVDASRRALELAERQFSLNELDPEDGRFSFAQGDVLEMLDDIESPLGESDLIICDPPAFAKSASRQPQAIKAYTELNAACLLRLKPGGILVTSSCSGRIDADTFRMVLRHAAGHAKKDVRLLEWLGQPADHAERLAFPEGRYLKTAILEVASGMKYEV